MEVTEMTEYTIKELKILIAELNSNIENDEQTSFVYWKASKLLHEHIVNVYAYNSEKIDFGYMLYRKEVFKIFNDNLYYLGLAVQQKNIKIKNFMNAYSKLLENLIYLKSYMKDLRGEYVTTTPKKLKQFVDVIACTNVFIEIVEKHIALIEERAKKL